MISSFRHLAARNHFWLQCWPIKINTQNTVLVLEGALTNKEYFTVYGAINKIINFIAKILNIY